MTGAATETAGSAGQDRIPTTAAWIDAGYWRIEGDLWCCPHCYAATPKPDEHSESHRWESMTQGQRVKAMLRREAERKINNAD